MQIINEKRKNYKITRTLRKLVIDEQCAVFSDKKRSVIDVTASKLKKNENLHFEVSVEHDAESNKDVIKVWRIEPPKDPTHIEAT